MSMNHWLFNKVKETLSIQINLFKQVIISFTPSFVVDFTKDSYAWFTIQSIRGSESWPGK